MRTCLNCKTELKGPPKYARFCMVNCTQEYLNIKPYYGRYDNRPIYDHVCRYCREPFQTWRKKGVFCCGAHVRFNRLFGKKFRKRMYDVYVEDGSGELVLKTPRKEISFDDLDNYVPKGDRILNHTFEPEPEPEIKHPVKCPVCEKDAPRAVWGAYQEFPWICSRVCLEESRRPTLEDIEAKARSNGAMPNVGDPGELREPLQMLRDCGIDPYARLKERKRAREKKRATTEEITKAVEDVLVSGEGVLLTKEETCERIAPESLVKEAVEVLEKVDGRTEAESIALAIQAAQALIRKASSDNLL